MVPLDFLRGLLGALCVFFAHFLGRSAVGVYRGSLKKSRVYGWLLRTVVTAAAIVWRKGLDLIAVVVFALAAIALALGAWAELRPRQQEDLTGEMFPKQNGGEEQS